MSFTFGGQGRLSGKVMCEQRHEGVAGASHADLGEKSFPGRRKQVQTY